MRLLSAILILSLMLASVNCQDQPSVTSNDSTATTVDVQPDKVHVVNTSPLPVEAVVSQPSETPTPSRQSPANNQQSSSDPSIDSKSPESSPLPPQQTVQTNSQLQNKQESFGAPIQRLQDQLGAQQNVINSDVQTISLDTLTQEQKKKMLEEEAILSAFHNNPDGGLSKYANMSAEKLVQVEKQIQEEARRAYENAMKQMEERDRRAAEELDRLMKEQKLSKTQRISHQENKEFKERQEQFNPRRFEPGRDAYYRHQFHEYMFQLQQGEQDDFSIALPIAQTVALYLYTYTSNNGIYTLADSLDDYLPAEVRIYQNNNREIISDSFYFKKYLIFEGKQHFTYSIKVSNPGNQRLFALNLVHLLEHTHIAHTFDSDAIVSHSARSVGLQEELQQKIEQTYRARIMQLNNHKQLSKRIRGYYLFNLAEMALVVCACLFQIKFIEKLLNSGSIV